MRHFWKSISFAAAVTGAAAAMPATAQAGVSVGVNIGVPAFYYGVGFYPPGPCDAFDYYYSGYCGYPVYAGAIFIDGLWVSGPHYYRWWGGRPLFWYRGGWHNWAGWRHARAHWSHAAGWGWRNGHWNRAWGRPLHIRARHGVAAHARAGIHRRTALHRGTHFRGHARTIGRHHATHFRSHARTIGRHHAGHFRGHTRAIGFHSRAHAGRAHFGGHRGIAHRGGGHRGH